MTVELFSNLAQTLVSVTASIFAIWYTNKYRKIEYALISGFFCSFALGIIYWLTYQFLNAKTPQIFYVADLAWIASGLFLFCLLSYITPTNIKKYRHISMNISLLISLIVLIYLSLGGGLLSNICYITPLAFCVYIALQNLFYCKSNNISSSQKPFHIFILVYVTNEYLLWISSYFWISDTLTNPYFWFDFLLTALVAVLFPIVKKAVSE